MKVRLRLGVPLNCLPAELIVRDYSGNIVFYKRRICADNYYTFCTRSRNLIFTVRPINADYAEISKFLRFPCAKCVCLKLFYGFSETPVYTAQNNFTLFDANYSFPIISATLSFTGIF